MENEILKSNEAIKKFPILKDEINNWKNKCEKLDRELHVQALHSLDNEKLLSKQKLELEETTRSNDMRESELDILYSDSKRYLNQFNHAQ